jgi:hypothetical protein
VFFFETGIYRIYGRVIAANDGDDSFWVRIDNNPWINWNTIKLGSNWHWDSLHLNNSTTPLTFAFNEQDVHTICVAYREDGAKLDSLLVTSDASINPATATQPLQPGPENRGATLPELTLLAGKTTIFAQWTAVPGATSYTLKSSQAADCLNDLTTFTAVRSNITNGFTFADTDSQRVAGSCYLVEATGGGTTVRSNVNAAGVEARFFEVKESSVFSVRRALRIPRVDRQNQPQHPPARESRGEWPGEPAVGAQAAGPHGHHPRFRPLGFPAGPEDGHPGLGPEHVLRQRHGFVLGAHGPRPLAEVERLAGGRRHQHLHAGRVHQQRALRRLGGGWIPLWDGDSPSAPEKIFTGLAAGTHTLELAFREPAAGMDRVVITSDINQMPGGCFD